MIKCKFREKEEFSTVLSENGRKKKKGRYHGSFFSGVEEFGKTNWIIMTEIDVTDNNYSLDSTNVKEIAEGCVEYLNQPPKRKRMTKKKIKLVYVWTCSRQAMRERIKTFGLKAKFTMVSREEKGPHLKNERQK